MSFAPQSRFVLAKLSLGALLLALLACSGATVAAPRVVIGELFSADG